jgi:hypothetical protein
MTRNKYLDMADEYQRQWAERTKPVPTVTPVPAPVAPVATPPAFATPLLSKILSAPAVPQTPRIPGPETILTPERLEAARGATVGMGDLRAVDVNAPISQSARSLQEMLQRTTKATQGMGDLRAVDAQRADQPQIPGGTIEPLRPSQKVGRPTKEVLERFGERLGRTFGDYATLHNLDRIMEAIWEPRREHFPSKEAYQYYLQTKKLSPKAGLPGYDEEGRALSENLAEKAASLVGGAAGLMGPFGIARAAVGTPVQAAARKLLTPKALATGAEKVSKIAATARKAAELAAAGGATFGTYSLTETLIDPRFEKMTPAQKAGHVAIGASLGAVLEPVIAIGGPKAVGEIASRIRGDKFTPPEVRIAQEALKPEYARPLQVPNPDGSVSQVPVWKFGDYAVVRGMTGDKTYSVYRVTEPGQDALLIRSGIKHEGQVIAAVRDSWKREMAWAEQVRKAEAGRAETGVPKPTEPKIEALPGRHQRGQQVNVVDAEGNLITPQPVKVTDVRYQDGMEYVQVQGSKTYFPASQIEVPGAQVERPAQVIAPPAALEPVGADPISGVAGEVEQTPQFQRAEDLAKPEVFLWVMQDLFRETGKPLAEFAKVTEAHKRLQDAVRKGDMARVQREYEKFWGAVEAVRTAPMSQIEAPGAQVERPAQAVAPPVEPKVPAKEPWEAVLRDETKVKTIFEDLDRLGVEIVGPDRWLTSKADVDTIAAKYPDVTVTVKDVNGHRAAFNIKDFAKLAKRNEFTDRIRQANLHLKSYPTYIPEGFMGGMLSRRQEAPSLKGEAAPTITVEPISGIEMVNNSTISRQQQQKFVDAVTDKRVRDALQERGVKRLSIDPPYKFGLSEQANIVLKDRAISVNADAEDPARSILHEIGHDVYDGLSKEQQALWAKRLKGIDNEVVRGYKSLNKPEEAFAETYTHRGEPWADDALNLELAPKARRAEPKPAEKIPVEAKPPAKTRILEAKETPVVALQKWDAMSEAERFELARSAGWASRTAAKMSRQKWSELSPAAQNVMPRKGRLEPPKATEKPPVKPAPALTGKTTTVKTERGTAIETQYAVVEAENLITSHDTALKVNPDYPKELQPRDRARPASRDQIARMIGWLEPEFLGESPKAAEGAPIVGPDMVVESGNARIITLKSVYDQKHDNAAKYREWLKANAQRFGLKSEDLENVKNPVLVRVRQSDIDRVQFVKEANEQAVAAMSASEQAFADADKITGGILDLFVPHEEGNVIHRGNWDFIRSFMDQVVGSAERGRYMTADGSISQDGANRIRNAIFARAYGDPAALAKLAESTDSNIRNITNAMLNAAPKLAKLKEGIEKGSLYDLDLTGDIAAAANKLSTLREQGLSVERYLAQGALFGEELSPLAKDILQVFDEHKRSGKKLASFLLAYAERVETMGDPRQTTLFETRPVPTKAEVLDAVIERVKLHGEAYQSTLFEGAAPAGEVARKPAVERRTEPARPEGPAAAVLKTADDIEAALKTDFSRIIVGADISVPRPLLDQLAAQVYGWDTVRNEDGSVTFSRPPDKATVREVQEAYGRLEQRDPSFKEEATKMAQEAVTETFSKRDLSTTGGMLPRVRSGVRTVAVGMRRDLIQDGETSLVGHQVETADELAVLAQILRDPRYETMRVFYVDKEDKILAHEAIKSGLPNAVHIGGKVGTAPKWIWKINDRVRRLNADGFYFLHNHPSGDPKPSFQDQLFTTQVGQSYSRRLKGHVIIDSNKYAVIDPSFVDSRVLERHGVRVYGYKVKDLSTEKTDLLLSPDVPHNALGELIASPDHLAFVGAMLPRRDGFVNLVYLDVKNTVRAIQEMPVNLFKREQEAADFMRGQARTFGASAVAAHYDGSGVEEVRRAAEKHVKNGTLLDMVFPRGVWPPLSVRRDVSPVPEERFVGREVSKRAVRVREEEQEYEGIDYLLKKTEAVPIKKSEKAKRPLVAKPEPVMEPKAPAPKPSVEAKTSEKEPWQMTREEFVSNPPPGFKYSGKKPAYAKEHIAWVDTDGRIVVSDDFFEHSPEWRRDIQKHEEAHRVEELVPPQIKAALFDNAEIMAYRGRNINEKLANWIQDGKPLPSIVQEALEKKLPEFRFGPNIKEALEILGASGIKGNYYLRWDAKEYTPGDALPPSRRWIDGTLINKTIGGTSVINPRYTKFTKHDLTTKYEGNVYLVEGKRLRAGQDPGEVILEDAKVVQKIAAAKAPEIEAALKTDKPEKAKRPSATYGSPVEAAEPAAVATREIPAVAREDIIRFIEQKFQVPVRRGRFRQKAAGIYKWKPEVIRTKGRFLFVHVHELGHHLDKRLGLSKNRAFDDELHALGSTLYPDMEDPKKLRREGIAEFMKYFVANEATAQMAAPRYYAEFQAILGRNPDLAEAVKELQTLYRAYMNLDPIRHMDTMLAPRGASLTERLRQSIRWSSIYTRAVDEFNVLRRTEDAILAGAERPDTGLLADVPLETIRQGEALRKQLPMSKSVFARRWRGRGQEGRAARWLFGDGRDKVPGGNPVGPSLTQILKPVHPRMDDFRRFIMALKADNAHQHNIETGYDPKQVKAAIAELDNPEFREAAEELVAFRRAVRDQLVAKDGKSAGFLTKEQAEAMDKKWEWPFPFYREFGIEGQAAPDRIVNLGQPIKRMKGSERPIIDPIVGIVRDTVQMLELAEMNQVAANLDQMAQSTEGMGWLVEKVPTPVDAVQFKLDEIKQFLDPETAELIDEKTVAVIFRPRRQPGAKETAEGIATIWIGGKPTFRQFAPDVHDALFKVGPEFGRHAEWIIKTLSVPARILRTSVTLGLEFMGRNVMRDTQEVWIYSKGGVTPKDTLVAGIEMLTAAMRGEKPKDYWRMASAGGFFRAAAVSMDRDYIGRSLEEMLGGKAAMHQKIGEIFLRPHRIPVHIFHGLEKWSEFFENINRYAEMKKVAGKIGWDPDAAMEVGLSGRDVTIDFARVGSRTEALRRVEAFWNATVQGMDKFFREHRDNPVRTMYRAFLYVTVPTILLYLINRDDPHYQELPRWRKDLFYNIPTGTYANGKHFFIPIPRVFAPLGLVYGMMPQRMLEYLDTNDKRAFEEFKDRFIAEVPIPRPTALTAIFAVWANKGWWGGPIVPREEERFLPEEQYDIRTSEVAKWIGKAFGTSPRKVDYAIRASTGYLGGYTTWTLDQIAIAVGVHKEPPAGVENVPVIRAFLVSAPGPSAASISRFYEERTEVDREYNTIKRRAERGEYDGLSEAKKLELLQQAVHLGARRKDMNKVADVLGDLRKTRQELQEGKTADVADLTPEQRKALMDAIDLMRTNVVRFYYEEEPLPVDSKTLKKQLGEGKK